MEMYDLHVFLKYYARMKMPKWLLTSVNWTLKRYRQKKFPGIHG